jgi:hypothetical protein
MSSERSEEPTAPCPDETIVGNVGAVCLLPGADKAAGCGGLTSPVGTAEAGTGVTPRMASELSSSSPVVESPPVDSVEATCTTPELRLFSRSFLRSLSLSTETFPLEANCGFPAHRLAELASLLALEGSELELVVDSGMVADESGSVT